ncbi:MAG TPA: hypothetical protein VGK67_03335 [Myxococcales bacterium]|jgi:hypothetical protein
MKPSTAGVIILLVVATGAALEYGPATWPKPRTLLGLADDSVPVAAAIGRALHSRSGAVGEVEVVGAEVRLLAGRLRLEVSDEREPGDAKDVAHFHVLAAADGVPSGRLDVCSMGWGATAELRFEDLAEAFAGVAFPPLLSRIKGEPLLEARPFWGDEPWAVNGFRGYVGPVVARGGAIDVASFEDSDFFSEIPGLPDDGRLHLVKAVLLSKGGFWERTIELDGRATAVAAARWSRVPATPAVAMAVRFAVYDQRDKPPAAEARQTALQRLEAREPWLFPADACPVDVMPTVLAEHSYSPLACRNGRLLDCLTACEKGSASYCYSAALDLQSPGSPKPGPEALFLRACRLGFASGCTNAAAGRLLVHEDACALRTFEKICERAGDPWACTMFGGALAKGDGVAKDPARAREVLAKSCSHGADDPACQGAEQILRSLDGTP